MDQQNFARLNFITRREFLVASGGVGAAVLLSGCGGDGSGGGSGEITFQTWASTAEEEAFREIIQRYEEENPDITVNLAVTPFDQHYQTLDTGLAAGEGPDIVRIQYQHVGRYSSEGVLLDLSDHLSSGDAEKFQEAFWQAILHEGTPYGLPLDNGAHALYYNTQVFNSLGINAPQSPEDSWTWDEFLDVARQIRDSGEVDYPFAIGWQGVPNAYRWMMFLFQNGGQLLNDELTAPAIDNPAGIEAVEFTKTWFEEDLVPPGTSIKSGTETEGLFANNTIAMWINGGFQMSFLRENMSDDGWDVTYLPRGTERANGLGGNAVVVNKESENADAAADFIRFLTSEQNAQDYVVRAQLLPTHTSLLEQSAEELGYDFRPDDRQVFLDEVPTVPPKLAEEQTMPEFNSIVQVLADELEAAFVSGQSAEDTVKNMSSGIEEVLGG